jgi:hypothetical protein
VEYGISASGKYDAEEFLSKTILRDFGGNGRQARRRLLAVFEYIADHGTSPRLGKKRGPIYGIKLEFANKLIRFACFQNGLCWVLTHGFYKPGAQKGRGPWPKAQLDKADRIRHEHLSRFRTNV